MTDRSADWPHCRGDHGQVAGIEVLPFGFLIFVVGSLLAANAWAVVDATFVMQAAAREATRAYVEAPDAMTASRLAPHTARTVTSDHGRDPDRVEISITHDGDAPWGRCVRVRITTAYEIPALQLPWIGGYGHSFDVHATHSELIDPYRAGVPGGDAC